MASGTRTLKVVITGDGKGGIRAFESLDKAAGRAGGSIEGNSRRGGAALAALGGAAGTAMKGLAVGAAAAAVGTGFLAKKVYDLGKSYEQNLNVLEGLDPSLTVNKTRAAIERMTPQMAKLGYNSQDASAALVELVKAGMDGDKAVGSLQATMVLARGGMVAVDHAATAVSNTMNVFGKGAGSAADISNVLANAANKSSASVGNLLESLQMSSAVAAQSNLSFAETSAALAILANNGMKGSDAGTSLKTMLMRLRAPVEGSQEALKALGVTVYDASGNMKPLATVLEDLRVSMQKLTEEEKANALQKIFGQDAIRSGTILIEEGAKGFNLMTEAVKQAGGAQQVAEARTEGLKGALDRLKAIVESTAQKLYMMVAPQIGAALNGLMDRAGMLGTALKELADRDARGFGEAMAKLFNKPTWADEFTTIGEKGIAMKDRLSTAFKQTNSDSSFMTQAGQRIKDIWGTVKPAISDFVGFVKTSLIPLFLDIIQQAQPTLTQLKSTFLTVFEAIKVAITVFVTVVKTIWRVFGGFILNTIKGFLNGVLTFFRGVFQVIQGVLNIFIGIFTGNWRKAWEGVKQVAEGVWNMIKGAFQAWLNFGILNLLRTGLLRIAGAWKGAWGGMKTFVVGLWNGIKTQWSQIMANIGGAARAGMNSTRNIFVKAWNAIKETVREVAVNVVNQVIRLVTGIKSKFSGAKTWLVSAGRDIIRGLMNGIRQMAKAAADQAGEIATKIKNKVKGMLGISSPSVVFRDEVGRWIPSGIAVGIEANASEVTDSLKNLSTGMTGSVQLPTASGNSLSSASLSAAPMGGNVAVRDVKAEVVIQVNGGSLDGDTTEDIRKAVQDALTETVREIRSGRR